MTPPIEYFFQENYFKEGFNPVLNDKDFKKSSLLEISQQFKLIEPYGCMHQIDLCC